MSGFIKSGFADLDNANLLVQIPESEQKEIDFQEKIEQVKNINYKKSSGGLSSGIIAVIIISCLLVLIAAAVLGIYFLRKKKIKPVNQGNISIAPNPSTYNINNNDL